MTRPPGYVVADDSSEAKQGLSASHAAPPDSKAARKVSMPDVALVGFTVALFALMFGYISACERLR